MRSSSRFFLPSLLIVGALGCSQAHRSSARPLPSRFYGITSQDIQRSPGVPLEQLLASRVPSVSLMRAADGRVVLVIRGQSSAQPREPLYLVNGVPLGAAANWAAIDPDDVESIEVLRDASSTALYGLLGSAGVILIKTKSS